MRIIEVESGKKKIELVCGLIWHPLQSIGSAQSKEIQTFAKNNGDDLKVLRHGESPHVGLTKKLEGAKPGQISLAAMLADALAEEKKTSCLIAIALPNDANSFVFVAIRDGVILADSDFVSTRDEIKVRLTGDVAYGGWDCVICPDEWAIMSASERDLESFLTPAALKNNKKWRLTETTLAWRKPATAFAILAIFIVAGNYGWQQWKHKQQMAAEALRLQQEEVEMGLKSAPTEPPKPWPLIPTAIDFAKACDQAYQSANTTAGNWQFKGASCKGQSLSLYWANNQSAWVSHLAISRPDITIAEDGLSAYLHISLDVPASNDFTATLPNVDGVQTNYLDIAQRIGISMQIERPKITAAPQALPGQPQNVSAPRSWNELYINVESIIEPQQVIAALDRSGLRIASIEYANKSGAPIYKISGVQYVNN